jgi:hypothetical protein
MPYYDDTLVTLSCQKRRRPSTAAHGNQLLAELLGGGPLQ